MKNHKLSFYFKSASYKKADSSIRLTALFFLLLIFQSPLLSSPLSPSSRLIVFSSSCLPFFSSSCLPFFSSSCLPFFSSLHLFPTGSGPEDMVVDSLSTPPRLLVSCASRRPEYPAYGDIEAIDPAQGKRLVLTRIGEPSGLIFRPHGISLVNSGEIQYLYVISHDDEKSIHSIIQYQVDGDSLIFIRLLNTSLLVSPNALQAFADGSQLVCNDAANRHDMKEKIFRLKRGNILFYDGIGNWSIAAKQLGMPAGLTGFGNRIFVSAALENKLYSYRFNDGQLSDKKQVCKIKGPDNIRIYHDLLIVTSHSKPFKFIRHVKNKSHRSPSLVVSIDPRNGKSTRLFHDNGKLISAASVALILNNQLIIGQIFEPFIGLLDIQR